MPQRRGRSRIARQTGEVSGLLATMADPDPVSQGRSGSLKFAPETFNTYQYNHKTCIGCLMKVTLLASRRLALTIFIGNLALQGMQLAVGPQPLWLRNHNFGLAQWIMVKRLATSCHDPLCITDSACKNQLVVVSVQYGPLNTYIPIRSTTIGKSRVARDPIAMHTSWRSNSDIASVTRTNQYNQDLGLIHSTNGNHLESPNEGSSIDHQVTIHLHAQNITMFPTNEIWYFTSQMLVSSSGGLILILTAQSTRNEFKMHNLRSSISLIIISTIFECLPLDDRSRELCCPWLPITDLDPVLGEMQYAMQSYYNCFRFYRSSVFDIFDHHLHHLRVPSTKSNIYN
ncbi:triacylglycerol lipase [Dorcoceras hygrometricum]|uniref:Triacylglycerol lipase n=1 Tax=Dorcoceras hygrometricum TaxID=472368 RepID=A0A2Z7C3G5_9LAMI|nr:triacylglycerol lipase [Dorcoceras hygrometricum]